MTRKEEVTGLTYKEESYAIIGACFAVYKEKGCGFLEPVYHESLGIEFESQSIPFLSKPPQTLQDRGRTLVQTFPRISSAMKKSLSRSRRCRRWLMNTELKSSATGCELALLVHFEHYPRVEYERLLPRKSELADLRL